MKAGTGRGPFTLLAPRRALLSLLALVAAAGLSACGFHLRQSVDLPFDRLTTNLAPTSGMARELKRQSPAHVQWVDTAAQSQVVLKVLEEKRARRAVSYSTAGQVRELQLILTLRFEVRDTKGKVLVPEAQLSMNRTISYIESAALAKQAEEDDIFDAMQRDLAGQVLRRLSTVRPEGV